MMGARAAGGGRRVVVEVVVLSSVQDAEIRRYWGFVRNED